MTVKCLAPVLNLSAQAQLLRLQVADDDNATSDYDSDNWHSVTSDDELDELENQESQTVVKVRILNFACVLVLQANSYQVPRLAVLVNSSLQ